MLLNILKKRFAAALSNLVDDTAPWLEHIRPAQNANFGDYQANMAMPLAKVLSGSPRDIAAKLLENLQWDDILEQPEIAGPGFINLRFRSDWLARQVQTALGDSRLGVPPVDTVKTVIVDYSSPNVAKPMHVGHIRSTMIGNSICRTLRFLGHNVIADNHIGDWGTQFGMIIYGFRNFKNEENWKKSPVTELGRLYRYVRKLVDYQAGKEAFAALPDRIAEKETAVQKQAENLAALKAADQTKGKSPELKKAARQLEDLRAELAGLKEKAADLQKKIDEVENDSALLAASNAHPGIGEAVLQETSKLHHGDEANRALWKEFLPCCLEDMNRIYRRLDVSFDTAYGESFYNDKFAPLVEDMIAKGVARESEGAVCVFLEGEETPMLIRKKDGAYLYATSDLATIEFREKNWQPDMILYVVDFRQSLHFNHLFSLVKKIGSTDADLVHVKFGTVLGDDGRPFKTRSGDTVGLDSLLDEAYSRAYKIVSENDDAKKDGPQLDEKERQETAERVGIGALVYADLSQNRESDYVFSYDKMLAMNGNTATYMQYAYARVRSIFTKGGIDTADLEKTAAGNDPVVQLNEPQERALALSLLRFSEAIDAAAKDFRPNMLTSYLYALANGYSSFFEQCPVLRAEDAAVKKSRLLLCDLTAKTIQKGLELLGIKTVERM